jgi:ribosomal protein L37AE/L43A
MAVQSVWLKYDAEILRRCNLGETAREIAVALDIPRFRVVEARKRLGLVKRNEHAEIKIHSDQPQKQYRCPVCRTLHWSDPGIWTCQSCKTKQEHNGDAEIVTYSVAGQRA